MYALKASTSEDFSTGEQRKNPIAETKMLEFRSTLLLDVKVNTWSEEWTKWRYTIIRAGLDIGYQRHLPYGRS